MSAQVKRHRVLGFFAGLVLGLGLALLLVVFGVMPLNVITIGAIAVGLAVLGIVLASVAPARAPKR